MSEELENRFLSFALAVRALCIKLSRDHINTEYIRQLIRASSSVGANYIEASDRLGKADETMKLKIARREAKETSFWLKLLYITPNEISLEQERNRLIDEPIQIKRILSAILLKRS